MLAEYFDVPATTLGVAQIHAEQVTGEDRRLVAAGAGAHFEIQVCLVARILRQQQQLQLTVEVEQPLFQPPHVVDGHLAQLGVVQHGAGFRQLAFGLSVLAQRAGDRFELGIFLRELAETGVVGVHVGLRQQPADFLVALGQYFELAADRWGHGSSDDGRGKRGGQAGLRRGE